MTVSLLSPPRAFHILGQRVLIHGEPRDADWMAPLAALFAPFTAPPDVAEADSPLPTRAFHVHREAAPARWMLHEDGAEPVMVEAAAPARDLEWLIFSALLRRAPFPLLLHAGAVARTGRALLLPGISGAGKSTLTLALATRGWQPLTDDLCPLDERGGKLEALPCPRCCHLSLASYLLLVRAGVAIERPIPALDSYARPLRWAERAPVAAIILPTYQAGAPLSLTPLLQAESLAGLLPLIFAQEHVSWARRLAVAKHLAQQAPAYRMIYSDIEEGLAAIEALAAGWEASTAHAAPMTPEPVGVLERGAE